MIYVLTPNPPVPSGGVTKLYRHVDILNRHGMNATVVHGDEGYRANWFANSTPIVYWRDGRAVKFDIEADILVVPETTIQFWVNIAPAVPKVIFNQGVYYTFHSDKIEKKLENFYLRPDVIGVLCVSEDSRQYLSWVFPNLFLQRIHHSIDSAVFSPLPKKPQVAFMPRRRMRHAVQLISMLRLRGILDGWVIAAIDGKSQQETATMLGESAIFLSFSDMEGFGLPPVEAMSCGCAVVGYHGGGGREYFLPEHSFPIDMGDIRAFAQRVSEVVTMFRDDRKRFDTIGAAARQFVRDTYTLEREEADIVNSWKAILARAGK